MKPNKLSHLLLVVLTTLFFINVGRTQSALPVCRSGAFENFQRGGCLCETTPGTVECFSHDNRTMVAQVNNYVSDELRAFRWSDTDIDVGRLYGTDNRYVYYCQSRVEKGYIVWPPLSDLGCFKVLGFCDPLAQSPADSRCCVMPHCANCTFPTLCTQCIDNYTLVNDTCVATTTLLQSSTDSTLLQTTSTSVTHSNSNSIDISTVLKTVSESKIP